MKESPSTGAILCAAAIALVAPQQTADAQQTGQTKNATHGGESNLNGIASLAICPFCKTPPPLLLDLPFDDASLTFRSAALSDTPEAPSTSQSHPRRDSATQTAPGRNQTTPHPHINQISSGTNTSHSSHQGRS